jgi:hypothetical protein
MDVKIVAGRGGQDVVVRGGVRRLIADRRGSVHEAVDIGRDRVLENLLDAAAELIRGLCPIVVFHRNNENGLDVIRPSTAETAKPEEKGAHTNDVQTSGVLHFRDPPKILRFRTVT